jgi:hypothetical protein
LNTAIATNTALELQKAGLQSESGTSGVLQVPDPLTTDIPFAQVDVDVVVTAPKKVVKAAVTVQLEAKGIPADLNKQITDALAGKTTDNNAVGKQIVSATKTALNKVICMRMGGEVKCNEGVELKNGFYAR